MQRGAALSGPGSERGAFQRAKGRGDGLGGGFFQGASVLWLVPLGFEDFLREIVFEINSAKRTKAKKRDEVLLREHEKWVKRPQNHLFETFSPHEK